MTPLSIKVYGMTEAENIHEVERLGIGMMGFTFYPKSPHYLCKSPDCLSIHAKRVGVSVSESKKNILMYVDRFVLDYIQLHSDESSEYCRPPYSNGPHPVKAFSIPHPKDLMCISVYKGLCGYHLFSTKIPQYGGSGNQFGWSPLYRRGGMTPSLLNGETSPCSIKATKEFRRPKLAGIDINSRLGTVPGQKDMERIKDFLQGIRNGETTNK